MLAHMTQNQQVLEALQSGQTLTQLEALLQFGVGRLAARIQDLEDEGFRIDSQMIEVIKADGTKTHVARYSMDTLL